jgi:hypothetical protein
MPQLAGTLLSRSATVRADMLGLTLSGIVTARVFVISLNVLPSYVIVALTVNVPDADDGRPEYHELSKVFVVVAPGLLFVSLLVPILYTILHVAVGYGFV